jgi:hypothetical protein
MERLEVLADGRLLHRFKRAWRDGTTHVILTALGMLEKLSALVPAPHAHLVRSPENSRRAPATRKLT